MQQLIVELGSRSYPIFIGSDLLPALSGTLSRYLNQHVFIVTDENVGPLYLDAVKAQLNGKNSVVFQIPANETSKNIAIWQQALETMVQAGFARDCTVLALGGGVVGDLAGFVAATFQRGIDFVQMPTTLLAQVDSSVGGKTAVNLTQGKNLVGAFHQPRAVFIDTQLLSSLPQRQLSAGLAEVIKYGIMADSNFFAWLETHMSELIALEPAALINAIQQSCRIKAAIVSDDEREQGARALLNLGHTFGHAIEQAQGFGTWLHGEAVAAGIAIAADLSVAQGTLSHADYQRVLALLRAAQLPTSAPAQMNWDTWHQLMLRDKKVHSGKVRFILPRGLGNAVVTDDVPLALVKEAVHRQRG